MTSHNFIKQQKAAVLKALPLFCMIMGKVQPVCLN